MTAKTQPRPYRLSWRRRLRLGCGVGYRDGRLLKNGVRLMDCTGCIEHAPGWVCDACHVMEVWEYGRRGDPQAEVVALTSAWLHDCGVWNPDPIVAILGWPSPAMLCGKSDRGYGTHLVRMERDRHDPAANSVDDTE